MVADVEQYVNSIIPIESDKASTIVDGVFQSVDSAFQENSTTSAAEGILTTYGQVDVPTTSDSGSSYTEGFDFNYLDDLLDGKYETDENGNIITTTAFDYDQNTTEKQNIIDKTVETVKEKPEIIAAPTGLIAVGAFAGYLMSKKHRDSEAYLESENADEEETEN
jgi:hypothetical protein